MRDFGLAAIIIGLIPFILRRPEVGILAWNWLAFMNPHRFTWGFAYDLPWSQIVAIATIGSLFLNWQNRKIPISGLVVVWACFVIWANVTTLFSLQLSDALYEWGRFMKIQLMVFVTLIVMRHPEHIKALVWVIVLSLGFFGLKGGYFALVTGGKYLVWGPPGSFIGGNNEVAFALIIVLPLMQFLRQLTPNKWIKLGMLGLMALSLVAVVSSYSRGAFIAASAMLLFLVLKTRRKLLLVPFLVLIVLSTITFMPDKWAERMESIKTYEEDKSAMGRINAWHFAYNLASDRPLVGGGFGTFQPDLFYKYAPNPEDFHDAHSIYFEVLGEHGFVGLCLYLCLAIGVLLLCRKVEKRARKRNKEELWIADLAAMIQVSFIGYGVGGVFLGLAYFDLPYQLFAILVLLQHQLKDEPQILDQSGQLMDTGQNQK